MTEEIEAKTSLAEAFREAFDAANKPIPEVKEEEVTQHEEENTKETPEEGREEVLDDIEEAAEKEFPLIPKDLSPEEQATWQALLDSDDPEKKLAAEVFIERYNLLKKGFYNKTKEYSQETKDYKEISGVFAPYKEQLKAQGISEAQYIKNMMQWDQQITKDPAGTIKTLMQRFGVKPEQIAPKDDFDYDLTEHQTNDNSEVARLKAELESIKSTVANLPIQEQIRQFENAKDSSGKLLHPRFKEVMPIMGNLIQQSDNKLTMEDAYKKAVRVFDDEDTVPAPAVNLDKLREKIAKSNKAKKSVTTKGGRVDYSKMSIKEEFAAKLMKN